MLEENEMQKIEHRTRTFPHTDADSRHKRTHLTTLHSFHIKVLCLSLKIICLQNNYSPISPATLVPVLFLYYKAQNAGIKSQRALITHILSIRKESYGLSAHQRTQQELECCVLTPTCEKIFHKGNVYI